MVKKAQREIRSEKGFTLLEIIVALAILSGIITAVITTLNYNFKVADNIGSLTTATMLAREKVEEINIGGLPTVKEGNFAPRFPGFRWSYSAEDLPGIKKIYITVAWGKGGKGREVSIETYRRAN